MNGISGIAFSDASVTSPFLCFWYQLINFLLLYFDFLCEVLQCYAELMLHQHVVQPSVYFHLLAAKQLLFVIYLHN